MDKCTICGGDMVEVSDHDRIVELDPGSAEGRRIGAGFCWVCERLKTSAEREAQTQEA